MNGLTKRWTGLLLAAALGISCLAGCSQPAAGTSEAAAGESTAATQAPATSAAPETTAAESEGIFTPGAYEAEGKGNNGPIKVSVTFTADSIEKVEIVEHGETAGISDAAIERIPQAIVENQSLAVDTVSGATNSSKGILEAVAACVTAAGADPQALMQEAQGTKEAQERDEECAILVIGAGGAGLTAALSAIQAGAQDVVVIEKQAMFAGASSVAGGLAGGCSELQRSFGITEDTPEQIFEDIMKGGQANQEDLVRLWAGEMGTTLDWLIENGVPIESQFSNFPEHTHQRSFMVTGGSGEMLKVLAEDVKAAGGRIDMETEATALLTENGAVTGAVAKDAQGNTVRYHADSVILASGGFGANTDMLSDDLSVALFYGVASSTGEGIRMAQEAGAELCFMDYAKMYPTGIQVEKNYARVATVHTALTTQTSGAILVNREGERVLNENLDFVSIKNATKEQTDHLLFLVMDKNAYDIWSQSANDSPSPSGRFTFEEQEAWFEADGVPIFTRSGDIAEAAEAAGIDAEALKATVEEWNQMVKDGKDSRFGREELTALEDGAWYIIEQKLRFATTLGGVTINTGFEVLDGEGNAIPGLYAAGECVGGAHGYESMPTCMLSWAVTSGKLAGAAVAAVVK